MSERQQSAPILIGFILEMKTLATFPKGSESFSNNNIQLWQPYDSLKEIIIAALLEVRLSIVSK